MNDCLPEDDSTQLTCSCSVAPPNGEKMLLPKQDSTQSCDSDCCDPAKLDAVLASVQQLIDCLNTEIDSDLSSHRVGMTTDPTPSLDDVTSLIGDWSRQAGANKQGADGDKQAAATRDVEGEKQTESRVTAKENNRDLLSTSLPNEVPDATDCEPSTAGLIMNKQMTHCDATIRESQEINKTASQPWASSLDQFKEKRAEGDDDSPSRKSRKIKRTISFAVRSNKFDQAVCLSDSAKKKYFSDEPVLCKESLLVNLPSSESLAFPLSSAQHLEELKKSKTRRKSSKFERLPFPMFSQKLESCKAIDMKAFLSQKIIGKNKLIEKEAQEEEKNENAVSCEELKSSVIERVHKRSLSRKKAFLSKQKKILQKFCQNQTLAVRRQSGNKSTEKNNCESDFAENFEREKRSLNSPSWQLDMSTVDKPLRTMRTTRSEPHEIYQTFFSHQPDDNDDDAFHNSNEAECYYGDDGGVVFQASTEQKLPPLHERETADEESLLPPGLSTDLVYPMAHPRPTSPRRWTFTDDSSKFMGSNLAFLPKHASTGQLEQLAVLKKGKSRERRRNTSQDGWNREHPLDTLSLSSAEKQSEILEPFSRFRATSRLTKLRKTLKNVGKASSTPLHFTDDMAKRTWTPWGDGTWSNLNGKRVDIESTHLQNLSELECDALRKLSLQKLNEAEFEVAIVVPKDESTLFKRKMSARKKHGMLLAFKEKNKDKNNDHVFGIPLINVVENDQLLRLQKSFSSWGCRHTESPPEECSASPGSSCSGSTSSINNQCQEHENGIDADHTTNKNDGDVFGIRDPSPITSPMSESEGCNGKESTSPSLTPTQTSKKFKTSSASQSLKRRGAIAANSNNEIDRDQSQLLEALSRSVQSGTSQKQKKFNDRSLLPPTMAQVPYVVQKCCDHIKNYGLDAEGIFRIAGSKKRIRQLREEFDRGIDVTIDEDYNPHDVAGLLKEFFRDLPEALLTRELYPAFIQITKLLKQQRHESLRYLLWLLPASNRDTLYTLLNFLSVVAKHSENACDQTGNTVPGNKMNIYNLSAIFGPNILHRYKKSQASNDSHYQGPCLEKPEESTAVIKVVEELITNQQQLFEIPKDIHDEILRNLKESDPAAVDYLLRRKLANQQRGSPHNSSRSSFSSVSPKFSCSHISTPPGNGKRRSASWDLDSQPDHQLDNNHEHSSRHVDRFSRKSTWRMSYQQATENCPMFLVDERENEHSTTECRRQFYLNGKCVDGDNNEEKEKSSSITTLTSEESLSEKSRNDIVFTDDKFSSVLGRKFSDSKKSDDERALNPRQLSHTRQVSPLALRKKDLQKSKSSPIVVTRTDTQNDVTVTSSGGISRAQNDDLNNNKYLYMSTNFNETSSINATTVNSSNNNNNNNNANQIFTTIDTNTVLSSSKPVPQHRNRRSAVTNRPTPLPRTRVPVCVASSETQCVITTGRLGETYFQATDMRVTASSGPLRSDLPIEKFPTSPHCWVEKGGLTKSRIPRWEPVGFRKDFKSNDFLPKTEENSRILNIEPIVASSSVTPVHQHNVKHNQKQLYETFV